jgi:intracellular sulfur oxidation DsrE/DsrF family protein
MHTSLEGTTHRRGFLGRLAAGAAAFTAFGATGVREAAAAVEQPGPPADAWLNGIKGQHKQFFDAVSVNEGFPFAFAMTYLNTMGETYKLTDKDITAVVGLRHFSIPLAFNNDIWKKYKLGEFAKVEDPATKAPAIRNPYAYVKPGELMFEGMAFEKLAARGVIFTVCNVALTVLSGMMTPAGGDKAKTYAEWKAGLHKGINIVPSGVLAVGRAQEKGCTYCSAA